MALCATDDEKFVGRSEIKPGDEEVRVIALPRTVRPEIRNRVLKETERMPAVHAHASHPVAEREITFRRLDGSDHVRRSPLRLRVTEFGQTPLAAAEIEFDLPDPGYVVMDGTTQIGRFLAGSDGRLTVIGLPREGVLTIRSSETSSSG